MMKHYINLFVFLGLVFTGAVFAVTENGVAIKNWRTSQGVRVYFVERPEIPMVDMAVIFAAGSAYDKQNWGLASFTADMLDEGTANKSAIDIASGFDQVGAQLGVSVNRDMAVVSLRAMTQPAYLTPSVQLFLDVLAQPSFPTASFVRVQRQVLDAIQQRLQDPSAVAQDAFFKSIYADQPYGHPVEGTLTTVGNIQLPEIKAFYQHFYVQGNAKIVLVGAMTEAEAHVLATKIATALPPGGAAPKLQQTVQRQKGDTVFVEMPVSQNTILIGKNAINRTSPDYYNLLVANHVLGGLPMTSRLFDRVRNDKGLAYAVYSGFMPLRVDGPFVILLQTRAAMSQQALAIAEATLAEYLAKGPTGEELAAAKLNLMGGFPLKISSNGGVLINVINVAFYGLPLDYLQTYPEKINAVTVVAAKTAFDKVVQTSWLNTIVAGAKYKK